MNTIYYKFPNSETANQIFLEAGFFVSGENEMILNTSTYDYIIDLVGSISGAENFYHVNLKPLSESFVPPTGAEPYIIPAPVTPNRVFL